MTSESPHDDVVRMRVEATQRLPPKPGRAAPTEAMAPQPDLTMSIAGLRENYDRITAARGIYYPVAYQFLRELGRGRQGIVFLGLRQGARGCITEHAIKLFDPGIYLSAEEYWTDMGRIASQVSRLQRVQSPNMVTRHSYEETYGIGYLQMEAIDGMDVQQLLTSEHLQRARARSNRWEWEWFTRTVFRIEGERVFLQPGSAVYVLRGMLRALERLHDAGFLHFDVKPANLMIDRLGTVKLIDFGRAVVRGERLRFLLGSPLYMAPETHRREHCDVQADLYSVGLVALELLRGRKLTEDPEVSEAELLELKLKLPGRLTKLLPPDVLENEALVSILRRLLDPDPAERFQDARSAEVGPEGLLVVDRQLVQAGLDSEYGRDLADYLDRLADQYTKRIERHGAR